MSGTSTRLQRRQGVRVAALVSGLVLAAAGCAPASDSKSSNDEGPIKLGLVLPLSGGLAAAGQDAQRGWELFWKEHPNGAGGRAIKTLVEDSGGQPDTALTKTRTLVQSEQVAAIVGPVLGNVGNAMADYLSGTDVPLFSPIASDDDLTQRKRQKNFVRLAGWSSSQASHPMGAWAAEQGYKRVLTICTDYTFGQENCGGFVNTFTDAGGKVEKQLWNPLGTQDFGPYMAQIKNANVDAVFATQVGGDAPRFLQAWQDFGLKGKVPLLVSSSAADQSTIRNLKGNVAEGLVAAERYSPGRPAAATQDFVKAYEAAHQQVPSYYAAAMYTAAAWIEKALEDNGGDASQQGLLDAVKGVTLEDGPMGPQRLDEYGNPVFDVYIDKVVAREGGKGYWTVPMKTIDDVTQFWTYDSKEFLAHPPYTRNYQGNGVWPAPQK